MVVVFLWVTVSSFGFFGRLNAPSEPIRTQPVTMPPHTFPLNNLLFILFFCNFA